jgi:hypothetical protein
MFDDLIIDFKIPIKALKNTEIEEFNVIIFEIRLKFPSKNCYYRYS